MKEISTIVVPVDLDRNTEKLVGFAIYMAQKLSSSLHLIHVVEHVSTGDMMVGSPSFEPIYQEQFARAEQRLKDLVDDHQDELPALTGTVVRGDIVDEIVSFAGEKQAGLVIIGTHGARGLERILLGSVAERVVKQVHCPTLTMNPYK